MLVKDFMIKNVITANEKDSIKDVMQLFVDHKIGSVPVVDENGILKGMISDGDIIRALKPVGNTYIDFYTFIVYNSPEELEETIQIKVTQPISKISKKIGIYTIFESDDLKEVLSVLSKHHFKKLPVVDENKKVVGVISRGDVIRHIKETIIQKL